jgi:hypothetical protein
VHVAGIIPGTGEPVGSIVGLICMSATFPARIADRGSDRSITGRLFRSWGGAVREVAERRVADGALREVASQKR